MPLAFLFSLKGLKTVKQSSSSSSKSSSRATVVAKVVNPFGTVTTITDASDDANREATQFTEEYSSGAYLYENCDESRFRPYVAILDSDATELGAVDEIEPEQISQRLIVPVIDASTVTEERSKRATKSATIKCQAIENIAKFEQMSLSNRSDTIEADKKEAKKSTKADKIADKNEQNLSKSAIATDTKSGKTTVDKTKKAADSGKQGKGKSGKTVTAKLSEPATEEPVVSKVKVLTFEQLNRHETVKSIDLIEEIDQLEPLSADITEELVEFVAPKAKAKQKALIDSCSTSKESSVEKELPAETTSKKKKKGRKSAEISVKAVFATDESKSDTNSDSQMDHVHVMTKSINNTNDDFSILDAIGHVDRTQYAEIQECLLKSSDTSAGIVMQRKLSQQENIDSSEAEEPTAKTTVTASKKKKKSSYGSIDIEPFVAHIQITDMDDLAQFEPSDLDSLSYKSMVDDQPIVTGGNSVGADSGAESAKDQLSDYDKLMDDTESGSDSKSSKFIGLEVRTSTTTSSDETEDSSRGKSAQSEDKTGDEDSDAVKVTEPAAIDVDDTNPTDAPADEEQSMATDAITVPTTQPQKPQQGNNNNKKKLRKKRR